MKSLNKYKGLVSIRKYPSVMNGHQDHNQIMLGNCAIKYVQNVVGLSKQFDKIKTPIPCRRHWKCHCISLFISDAQTLHTKRIYGLS